MKLTRREILKGAISTSAMAGIGMFSIRDALAGNDVYRDVFSKLDEYAERFLRESNSPGMTLVLADKAGIQRMVNYGFCDLRQEVPIDEGKLFQIGSISKSFVAICLLQLRREGRIDFHRPVTDYLPWLKIESKHAPITTHHLLTHSSGLPAYTNEIFTDPSQSHRAAYAPGERFYYNNMGYTILGHLAWTLDGRLLPELLNERVLKPLGMTNTESAITFDMHGKMVASYTAAMSDRPHSRNGRLVECPGIVYTSGAGCISSTARDMGAYLQMLITRGTGPNGDILTEDDFRRFSTGYIADPSMPDAKYGYGIYAENIDGRPMLSHTGGMTSFVSSLLIDQDAGIGAFAALNALDRAPTPVIHYATQLLRAHRQQRTFPVAPASPLPAWHVEAADDYAGTYRDDDGRTREIVADGSRLYLMYKGAKVVLEPNGGAGRFLALHPDLNRYAWVFGRDETSDGSGAVTELGWGEHWYRNSLYSGPTSFPYPREWDSFVGHYCDIGPRIRSSRVVIRKGQLLMNGTTPLKAGGDMFLYEGKEPTPEWIRFGSVVNGCAMWLNASGRIIWRVPVA